MAVDSSASNSQGLSHTLTWFPDCESVEARPGALIDKRHPPANEHSMVGDVSVTV